MKKISIIISAIALLSNYIQAESLLRKFEDIKGDAISTVKKEVDTVKADWDRVIDYLDKSLYHAKTLRAAHASLEQHEEASETLHKKLGKSVSGKTKSKLNKYKTDAKKADSQADKERKKMKEDAKKMHDNLEKSVKKAKENHQEVVQSHNDIQKAMAHEDIVNKNKKAKIKCKSC